VTGPLVPGLRSEKPHGFRPWELVFLALLFCFSVWLMLWTFGYDSENSRILISKGMWSDLGATLPLIRSFSMGDNWPPEYPIFPGHPIRYHYLFFLIVGKLEAIRVPLNWAMNVPSVMGFFSILLFIYLLAKKWFGDARIAVLGVAFFLLNGSMGFLQFFDEFPLSLNTLNDIAANDHFSAMGPWDRGDVLGVWHLLVFINQRHFGIALGCLLGFIYVCQWLEGKSKRTQLYWALFFGVVIGIFPLFHKAVLLIFAVTMSIYFVLLPFSRLFLFATGAVSIVVMAMLFVLPLNAFGAPPGFGWYPGFMIHGTLSLVNALKFFWYQFGLHCILIPIGFCLAPRRVKIFMLPAFVVIVVGFLFRFSQIEVLVGHKLFNFFLIIAQMLTALAIVKAYDFVAARFPRTKILSFGMAGTLVFFLTFTGIIDFVPIVHMKTYKKRDVGSDPIVTWFAENIPKDAVVLSGQFLYSPASVAGRKIFLGYAYFTDSAGYNTRSRRKIVDAIYSGRSKQSMCRLLHLNNISYIDVEDFKASPARPTVNFEYFRANFSPIYVSSNGRFEVYETSDLCK
jgi:hypothetical protein